jgi:PD-(D/E)XK nuclease superfamily protein
MPAAMADLVNEFSWSKSRNGVFDECKRRYFYQYYGAWGGWDPAAPDEVKRLYVLKQLATRQMWAGRIVHDAIEMALAALRDGHGVPVDAFVRDVVARMRTEWRSSRDGRYRDNPRTCALFEHEYAVDVAPAAWQMLKTNVETCLRKFFALPLLAQIRSTPPEHWSIEHWSRSFEFEGTPMWIAPDFGFWNADGRLTLVDWKTGGANPDAAAFQLGCYALYARDMLGVEPANVDLLEVNLREPVVTRHTWDAVRLAEVREQLRLSIRGMKAYLADPERNLAVIEAFERTEQLRICRRCNYRAVCRPELER